MSLLARTAAGFDARALEASRHRAGNGRGGILQAQHAARQVHLSDGLRDYAYRIVVATRAHPRLTLGASPRAGIASCSRRRRRPRRIHGRDFATPDDVKDVAGIVIPHRLIVAPDAEIEGISARNVLDEVLAPVSGRGAG